MLKEPLAFAGITFRASFPTSIEVTEIIDVTPTPHNGCRPRKRRRV